MIGCLLLPGLVAWLPISIIHPKDEKFHPAQPIALVKDESIDLPSRPADTGPISASIEESALHPNQDVQLHATSFNYLFLTIIWAVVTAILLVMMILGMARWSRLARAATALEGESWGADTDMVARSLGLNPTRIRLCQSDRLHSPLVIGLWKPAIILPIVADKWDREKRLQILQHEAAHVLRWDSLTQSLAAVVTAFLWFNPLAWLALHRILVERERACDDHVIQAGGDPTSYAHHLLSMARDTSGSAQPLKLEVAMARRSEISGRLLAILDLHRNRQAPGRATWSGALILSLFLTFSLAAMSPVGRAAPLIQASDNSIQGSHLEDQRRQETKEWTQEEIREVIEQTNRTIERAIAAGDLNAMLEPYSPDMHLLAMGGAEGRGLKDMRQALGRMIANYRKLEITTREVEIIHEGLAFETGTYHYSRGKEPMSLSGRYLSIWRYEDGRWLIYRDISNF